MSLPICVAPYTSQWVDAVRAFNQRIRASRQELPESPSPNWMPGMEVFLATEGDSVRGGYILRRQRFWAAGKESDAAHYRLPLSEGVVDRRYATLGLRLVRDALRREPRLYALGMGAWDKPLPQMLKRLGWRMCEVPFYFRVLHAARFLRNIRAVRTTALRRLVLDAAALTGAGWLGMKLLDRGARAAVAKFDRPPAFQSWADDVWGRGCDACALVAKRDAGTLNALYPPGDARFLRVRAPGGWALLLDTQMQNHKQFGDMRVGSIVDCMASPGEAVAVVRAAANFLEERGVDLIVSNQLHKDWSAALQQAGFRGGPSNFLLALSPALAALAGDAPEHAFHFNRGDGDGPIHL